MNAFLLDFFLGNSAAKLIHSPWHRLSGNVHGQPIFREYKEAKAFLQGLAISRNSFTNGQYGRHGLPQSRLR